MDELTCNQTKVCEAFWAQVANGDPCGKDTLARITGIGPSGVQDAMGSLIARKLIPERPNRSTVTPPEWGERSFMLQYEWGRKFLGGSADFEVETLPEELPTAEEILARKRTIYEQKDKFHEATKLVTVNIKTEGPVGIMFFGDPHIDDDGCDIFQLERDVKLVSDTDGLLGANVGDLQNNWIGRLSGLYGNQTTSALEAWVLVEWLVKAVPWLYIARGNHDVWSGAGDPLRWITRGAGVLSKAHGVRIALSHPNGKVVRNNCRHDFPGHSMWNPVHAPNKAFMMGWKDHLLTCGHKHNSGHAILKEPMSGLIAHAIRLAGYKRVDEYADKLGLPDGNVSGGNVVVIDPRYDDNDPRLLTWFPSTEVGAEFLSWVRSKKSS
jgi:hypothetical protein